MTKKEKQRMWDIDSKSQLGDPISDEDKQWFNDNYQEMMQDAQDEINHWLYHSGKFNY